MEGFPATGLCGLCLVLGRAVQLARLGNRRWDIWERMAGKMVNFLEIDGIEWRTTETRELDEEFPHHFSMLFTCRLFRTMASSDKKKPRQRQARVHPNGRGEHRQ